MSRALLLAALLALCGRAGAQALDGSWMRLDVSLEASVTSPGFALEPYRPKFSLYLFFESTGPTGDGVPGHTYDVRTVVRRGPGEWALGTPLSMTFRGTQQEQLPTTFLTLEHDGLQALGLLAAGCKVKLTKTGQLKRARLKTSGGVLFKGQTAEGDAVDGGFTARGRTVPEQKLPFDPAALGL